MRLPRDLSWADLVKRLERFGYSGTRQTGSHMRLTSTTRGEHHITIPNHDPLRLDARRHSRQRSRRITASRAMSSSNDYLIE